MTEPKRVEYGVHSNVYVDRTVAFYEVPGMSHGEIQSVTPAYECGECGAIVASEHKARHDMFHTDLWNLDERMQGLA